MDTAKRVSSGIYSETGKTQCICRQWNKRTVTISAIVSICVSSVLVVYLFNSDMFCFLLNSESSRNGSKVRRGPFPFIPVASPRGRSSILHPEVHCAVPLSSAPHEIEFLR